MSLKVQLLYLQFLLSYGKTSEPYCIKNATDVIEIEKKCDSENTI